MDADEGLYVDGDGYFWDTNRITGEVVGSRRYSITTFYTSPDCTTGEFVGVSHTRLVFEFEGVFRAPPDGAAPQPLVSASQRIGSNCIPSDWVDCIDGVLCYDVATVRSWPALQQPTPAAPPLHAEFVR